jgi:lipopolysaccharide/colanic/teichoic acid biosynthesis glycosyltransferase
LRISWDAPGSHRVRSDAVVVVASRSKWRLLVKRGVDLVLSSLGLLFLSPFFLVIAVLIKTTSKGPVFFQQRRVGMNGEIFVMFKFRTMRADAERELSERPELMEWDGPIFRVRNDPRVTSVGKWLRKFSLDEFPQLFNVVMGEMSLVGPRPHLVEEAARYEPWHWERLACKPGLTCLWGVSGRHQLSFDDGIRLDLQYLDGWSLSLDFWIMLRTIPAVMREP